MTTKDLKEAIYFLVGRHDLYHSTKNRVQELHDMIIDLIKDEKQ